MTDTEKVGHCAKFSAPIIDRLAVLLEDAPGPILDPFAGVGGIHTIGRDDTIGIEIQKVWADQHHRTHHGDANDVEAILHRIGHNHAGTVVFSPDYGNRFSDQYLGPICRACEGLGSKSKKHKGTPEYERCDKCKGSGHDSTGRDSYAIRLGEKVDPKSSVQYGWGPSYKAFFARFMSNLLPVIPVGPGRLFINISDHMRTETILGVTAQRRKHVSKFWIDLAHSNGFALTHAETIGTQRYGYGQNNEARIDGELLLAFDRQEHGGLRI